MLLKWYYHRVSRNSFSESRYKPVSEKDHHSCQIGSFLLNWVKILLFLKSINGGVGSKNFLILKWSCLRVSKNIFSGIRFIRASEKSNHRLLRGSFLSNWEKISLLLQSANGVVKTKIFLFLKWPCLRVSRAIFSGSRCILVSEKSH